jgi:hypothetical protein
VVEFGLKNATALFVLAVLTLFLTLIHLGFGSATALASANDADRHRGTAGCRNAQHQHCRNDDAAAIRGQLRFHPGGERAAASGGASDDIIDQVISPRRQGNRDIRRLVEAEAGNS